MKMLNRRFIYRQKRRLHTQRKRQVLSQKKEAMKFPLKIIFITLLILIISMILNSFLSILSFEKIYTSSLISVYEAGGKNLKRKIEQSLRFGKPLDKFQGMDILLAQAIEKNPEIAYASVGTPKGEILYHTDPSQIGDQFSYKIPKFSSDEIAVTKLQKGMYLTFLPIYGRSDNLEGVILMTFSRDLVYQKLKGMGLENLTMLAFLTFGTALLLTGLLAVFTRDMIKINFHIRIFIISMVVIVAGQLVYSYFNLNYFKGSHLQTVQTKCLKFGKYLKEDVEYVLNLNIPLSRLFNLESTMKDILAVTPELEFIEITDLDQNVLYYADHETMKRVEPGERKSAESADTVLPVFHTRENKQVGMIKMKISTQIIESKSKEILLDMITVILTSLLITFEVLSFSLNRTIARFRKKENLVHYSYIRPIIFLFIMADAFSISFLPLYADKFYQPMWELSREVQMGLPISVFMLSVVFSMLMAGTWSDRAGWLRPLVIGIFANSVGLILTAVAQNMVQLLLFRCITAFGFGLVFIAGQRFVVDYTDAKERSLGMASFLSAFFAGSICGTVMGGMLADRIGYRNVFVFSGIISLFTLFFCLYIFKNLTLKPKPKETIQSHFSFKALFRVLKDPEFVSVVFLQAIPAKIILIGCLFYLIPLYLKSINVLQSNIGRVLMIYDVLIVFFGYLFSKYFDKENYRKYYIFAGGFITGLSMILFNDAASGFLATLLLISAIGVSHTFSMSSQLSVITETEAIKEIGIGTGMGVFRFWERLGNVAGPLIVGYLTITMGYVETIFVLGIMSVICSLLYLMTIFYRNVSRGEANAALSVLR